jgi:hypothetical protein
MALASRLAGAAVAACALMAAAPPATPAPATVMKPLARAVIRADQLTERQFRQQHARLADNDVVEIDGRRLTGAQLRADNVRLLKEAASKAAAAVRPRRASFEARLRDLAKRRQEKLAAANARALAEFRRLATSPDAGAGAAEAIRAEALELQARAKGASPAERARIETRAAELLDRLARARASLPPTPKPHH